MLNTQQKLQPDNQHKGKGEALNEKEISNRYLKPTKPHASESTCNSTQKGGSAQENQENGPADKKDSKSAEKHLDHLNIPTFSERNLRVYQKLGEGKTTLTTHNLLFVC